MLHRPKKASDHLGTPQRLTDEMGAVVWSAGHEPFGQAADRNSYKQAAISGTVLRPGDGAALQLLPGLRSVDRAVLPE